jgi:LysM repeat protein
MKRKHILRCILIFSTLAIMLGAIRADRADASPLTAGMLNAGEIISRINAYRSNNGLYAYETNQVLMRIAQAQSDYQASIQSVTHTGPGGTRPVDRAYAAGYGGGNTVWVSEIIYGGTQASVDSAMSWWKESAVHNSSMLSSQYLEVGAGVASSGGSTYYTVVMGYVAGTAPEESDAPEASAVDGDGAPAVVPFNPVMPAEPGEDGSIIHQVQAGQSMWTIAAVYEIPLEQLLELNDLTQSSFLQPGQELIIRPPQEAISTPTATVGPTNTPTPPPPTRTPQGTPLPRPTTTTLDGIALADTGARDLAAEPASTGSKGGLSTIGAIAIGMVVLYGVLITVAGSFRNLDDEGEQSP